MEKSYCEHAKMDQRLVLRLGWRGSTATSPVCFLCSVALVSLDKSYAKPQSILGYVG